MASTLIVLEKSRFVNEIWYTDFMLKVKNLLKKKESVRAVPEGGVPVVRASICTGERVAGFHFDDGRFEEICLIKDDAALAAFAGEYGIDPKKIKTFY